MILIVGAGPAGSLAAYLLGKKEDVMIAEEHQSAGFPVQCAGLISKECAEAYGKYCNIKKAVENYIEGAFFFSPSGKFFEARGKALVIERKILDEMLLEKASEFAEVFMKQRVRFKEKRAFLGEKEVRAEYIIGSDGVNSEVARAFGFERPPFFTAVQIETKFEALDDSFVEIYLGRNYSEFFAYAVPLAETARIGVIAKGNALLYLKRLIEKHPSVSRRVKGGIIELNCGMIPGKLVDFVKGKIALIGDSAGMVKPYSGGGLFYLLKAAEKLAEKFPNLQAYKGAFMKELGKEIKLGEKIRNLYWLSNEEIEKLVESLRNFDFSGMHMDRPSSLFEKSFYVLRFLLRNPFLIKIALKIFRTSESSLKLLSDPISELKEERMPNPRRRHPLS